MYDPKRPPTWKPVFGPDAEWKKRLVLWVTRNRVLHVARHAATIMIAGAGVVSKILCGGASSMSPEATTWYDMKRRGHRFCRACVAELAPARGRRRRRRRARRS